ncbi:MAG: hypothetical protein R3B09_30220 [Nannocystaceae bacterium]
MITAALAAALGLAPPPGEAAARTTSPRCELHGAPTLVARVRGVDGRASVRVDATLGETVDVFLRAPGRLDGRAVTFADDGEAGHVSWTEAGCPAATLRWRRIEPRMEHVDTAPPNPGISIYANAVVFGPHHGQWIGHDAIEYVEAPIAAGDDRWTIAVTEATPSDAALAAARPPEARGRGVMRLSASLQVGDEAPRQTPGIGPRGVGDDVLRYTFRGGDDLFGWLTTFFNVPYVFGSAGVGARAQAERYVGADCADLIVAALRRAGRREQGYTSVAGLIRALRAQSEPIEIRAGAPAPAVDYAPRPGDVLAIDYLNAAELPRPWDHVVVFAVDRGPGGVADGRLGPEDQVADIGDQRGLKFAPLGDQGAVRVLPLRGR